MPIHTARATLLHRLQITFALLGGLASAYLLVQHTRLKNGIQESASFCSLGGYADCDAVNASPYSEIGGVPLASFGVVFFFACLILSLLSRPSDKTFGRAQRLLAILASLSLLADVGLIGVQIFAIRSACLFCFLTYICSAGILVTALLMTEVKSWKARFTALFSKNQDSEKFSSPILVLAIGGLAAIAIVVALLPSYIGMQSGNYSNVDNALAQFFKSWPDRPMKKIELKEDGATYGNLAARVHVVAYSDFQCPFCRKAAFTLHTWMKSHENRVHFSFKNFPLDSTCNPGLQYQMHPQACMLAKLSLCAGQKGKFWEFHDLIFLHISESDVEKGLDTIRPQVQSVFSPEEITTCLKDEKISRQLSDDIRLGTQIGVAGTPAVYINGKLVSIPLTLKNLNRLIEMEEAAAR